MKHFESSGGLERVITKLSDHWQINRTVYDLTGVSSIHPGEWLAKTVFKWDNDERSKFIIVSLLQ